MKEGLSFQLNKKWMILIGFLALVFLGLIFLLGARLGGTWMHPTQNENTDSKTTAASAKAVAQNEENLNTNSQAEVENDDNGAQDKDEGSAVNGDDDGHDTYQPNQQLDEGAPKYEVDAKGGSIQTHDADDSVAIGTRQASALGSEQNESQDSNDAGPMYTLKDPQTMVRFKSSDHSRFAVQVAEFGDEVAATKRINDLHKKGYDAYLVIENANSYARNYCVRVGAFSDHHAAESLAASLSNDQGIELRVVRIN